MLATFVRVTGWQLGRGAAQYMRTVFYMVKHIRQSDRPLRQAVFTSLLVLATLMDVSLSRP
jgi:hypothetical protein